MMNRSSKTITLVLVGSTAALAGFGVLHRATNPAGDDSAQMSDFGTDEEGLVGGTQPSTRPGSSRRHFVGTSPGYSSSHYRTYSSPGYRSSGSSGTITRSSSSSGSSSSGSSSSHGSGTSRGGFGSSGHAASSSS
jgi:hypothetical protein